MNDHKTPFDIEELPEGSFIRAFESRGQNNSPHVTSHWTKAFTPASLAPSPPPHPSHISASSVGKVIDVLSSTITAENCFKRGISTFSLFKCTSASLCMILRNIFAHSGVKRWLIADSVT